MLAPNLDYDVSSYADFVIELRSEGHNVFIARVTQSPVGESRDCVFKLPLDQAEIDDALASISYTSSNLLQRSAPRSSSYDQIMTIGRVLFTAMTEGTELGRLYVAAQDLVRRNSQGLRLHISTQDARVAEIPWEFLYDPNPRQPDFVVLSWRTPLIRQWGTTLHAIAPIEPPLRLLVVSAEVTPMSIQQEIDALHALASDPNLLTIKTIQNATKEMFLGALQQEEFHALHFIGAGTWADPESRWNPYSPVDPKHGQQVLLVFGAPQGSKDSVTFVSADEMNSALLNKSTLRFVVLSSDRSEQVAQALTQTAPAVLGIRNEITNQAAIPLMTTIYQGLLQGRTLDAAVTEGRLAIDRQNPGSREWGLPELYIQADQSPSLALSAFTKQAASAKAAQSVYETNASQTLSSATVKEIYEQQKLQSQLEVEQTNLTSLQQQKAAFGDPTPAYLNTEISETEQRIAKITAALQTLTNHPA